MEWLAERSIQDLGLGELPGAQCGATAWGPAGNELESIRASLLHASVSSNEESRRIIRANGFVRLSAVLGMWLMARGEFGVGVCSQENPNPT